MTYQEWKERKHPEWISQNASAVQDYSVVDGRDISGSWERRPEQFAFEIEDVIAAQGFDGLPRVVSGEEFDKCVEESGFIAQRTYSAPDQETLDAYKKQLYNEKWYVDCSTGGASLGQGMYSVSNSTGTITKEMSHEMSLYQDIANRKLGRAMTTDEKVEYMNNKIRSLGYDNKTAELLIKIIDNQTFSVGSFSDAMSAFNSLKNGYDLVDKVKQEINIANIYEARITPAHRVETFTLDPSARIARYSDLLKEYQSSGSKMDIGAFAAMKGYDAYTAPAEFSGADYTVVLNRTKVIFKGE